MKKTKPKLIKSKYGLGKCGRRLALEKKLPGMRNKVASVTDATVCDIIEIKGLVKKLIWSGDKEPKVKYIGGQTVIVFFVPGTLYDPKSKKVIVVVGSLQMFEDWRDVFR